MTGQSIRELPSVLDSALLLLRVTLGGYLVLHGIQKVDRRMSGGGLTAEAGRLAADGIRNSKALAGLSAVTQTGAGCLLAAGLLTPLAAAGAVGVMAVAAAAKLRHGFWVWADGAEFPLFLCVTAVVIGLSGPGNWSLDDALTISPTPTLSVAAVVLGGLIGLGSIPFLRQPRLEPQPTPDPT